MSKAGLLEEISKLTPMERGEIWDALWTLKEQHLPGSISPSDYEKAVLDREMKDYQKYPQAGKPWSEVEGWLRNHP